VLKEGFLPEVRRPSALFVKQAPDAEAEQNRRLVLDSLTRGLSDPDVRSRLAAVDALELMGEEAIPAIPALVRALSDTNRFVRWSAARTLGKLAPQGAKTAIPALTRLFSPREDLDVRLAVADALKQFGSQAREAVPTLTEGVNRGDDTSRIAAMRTLEAIGTDSTPALPAIARELKNPDPRVRRAAAEVLGRFRSLATRFAPQLRPLLEDSDPDVRRAASEALLNLTVQP